MAEIEQYIQVYYQKENGKHVNVRKLNPEWIKAQFRKGNCELLDDYVNDTTPMKYKYKDIIFKITWGRWRAGYRPHLKYEEEVNKGEQEWGFNKNGYITVRKYKLKK